MTKDKGTKDRSAIRVGDVGGGLEYARKELSARRQFTLSYFVSEPRVTRYAGRDILNHDGFVAGSIPPFLHFSNICFNLASPLLTLQDAIGEH
jgi:hypothetical protein